MANLNALAESFLRSANYNSVAIAIILHLTQLFSLLAQQLGLSCDKDSLCMHM